MTKAEAEIHRPPLSRAPVGELIRWAVGRRKRFRVDGRSMRPDLDDGDHVLVRMSNRAIAGNIVVCRHPFKTDVYLIKRVEGVNAEGMMLRGDNRAESTDSSQLGRIPWVHLVGCVTFKI